jgi:fructose-bisphosphate aldolase class I
MSDYPIPFFPEYKYRDELIATAKKIASPGKGILAADESTGTIAKRFKEIKVENTRENRREFRRLLFTAPGLNKHISGVILYEETLFDTTEDGKKKLVDFLTEQGIVLGIKTDKGTKHLPGTDDEQYTQGLTDLDQRCEKYYQAGARFCKWRAVIKISRNCPSPLSIQENAFTLARYAAISQAHGLVPIVEPEILMDGPHSLEICQYWTEKVVAACYKALSDNHVLLEGTLLKPNMVLPGTECKNQRDSKTIGRATADAMRRTVPAAVPGIMFLSGGQSEVTATLNLNAINQEPNRPWSVSFSYGRALQQSCLKAWMGKPENVPAAQKALLQRARANGLANLGQYTGEEGGASSAAGQSLHVKNYTY